MRERFAGSPRTLNDSVDARPSQSPRTACEVLVLVASLAVAGFTTLERLSAVMGVTRPNRIRERWAHVFAGRPRHWSSPGCHRPPGLGPFRVVGYPRTPDRRYMLNEQFTWLTPFSQQESPELTWRDPRTRREAYQVSFVSIVSIVVVQRVNGSELLIRNRL
jgi:hypothetical protein